MPVITRTSTGAVIIDRNNTLRVTVTPQPSVAIVDQGTDIDVVVDRVSVVKSSGIGLQGVQGPPGTDVGSAPMRSFTSDEPTPLLRGQAVCLRNGLLRRASANAPFQECIGLVVEDSIGQGAAGRVQTDGNFTHTALMWQDATGMVGGLAVGQTYFLTPDGHIQPFVGSGPGQYVAAVGIAIDDTTLRIEIENTILL